MAPEDLEVNRASVTLYTKHFCRTINATMCHVIHHSEKWHCGHYDHSSMSILHNGITSCLSGSPETCKAMGEGREVIIHGQSLKFTKGRKQVQTRHAKYGNGWDGKLDLDTSNECKSGRWIKREMFESHMQDADLSV